MRPFRRASAPSTASGGPKTLRSTSCRPLAPRLGPETAPFSNPNLRSPTVPRETRPRRRPRPPAAALASSTATLASTTFSVATVAAVCAYAALVTRPRSRLATFLTTSPLLPLLGCLSYLFAACVFWPGAVSEAASRAFSPSRFLKLPDTSLFAALFASSPGATAMTWLHLLAGDFAAAAWVVRDARRLGGGGSEGGSRLFAWTDDDDDGESDDERKEKSESFSWKRPKHFPCAASVVLCFMAGPLGITSHLLTRRLWYLLGWAKEAKREVIDGDDGSGRGVALSTF